jgi:hypothetical protein
MENRNGGMALGGSKMKNENGGMAKQEWKIGLETWQSRRVGPNWNIPE